MIIKLTQSAATVSDEINDDATTQSDDASTIDTVDTDIATQNNASLGDAVEATTQSDADSVDGLGSTQSTGEVDSTATIDTTDAVENDPVDELGTKSTQSEVETSDNDDFLAKLANLETLIAAKESKKALEDINEYLENFNVDNDGIKDNDRINVGFTKMVGDGFKAAFENSLGPLFSGDSPKLSYNSDEGTYELTSGTNPTEAEIQMIKTAFEAGKKAEDSLMEKQETAAKKIQALARGFIIRNKTIETNAAQQIR